MHPLHPSSSGLTRGSTHVPKTERQMGIGTRPRMTAEQAGTCLLTQNKPNRVNDA